MVALPLPLGRRRDDGKGLNFRNFRRFQASSPLQSPLFRMHTQPRQIRVVEPITMAAMTPTMIPGWQRYMFLSPHSPLLTLVFLCVGVGVAVGEVVGDDAIVSCVLVVYTASGKVEYR